MNSMSYRYSHRYLYSNIQPVLTASTNQPAIDKNMIWISGSEYQLYGAVKHEQIIIFISGYFRVLYYMAVSDLISQDRWLNSRKLRLI
jgi:hypothetical protein